MNKELRVIYFSHVFIFLGGTNKCEKITKSFYVLLYLTVLFGSSKYCFVKFFSIFLVFLVLTFVNVNRPGNL